MQSRVDVNAFAPCNAITISVIWNTACKKLSSESSISSSYDWLVWDVATSAEVVRLTGPLVAFGVRDPGEETCTLSWTMLVIGTYFQIILYNVLIYEPSSFTLSHFPWRVLSDIYRTIVYWVLLLWVCLFMTGFAGTLGMLLFLKSPSRGFLSLWGVWGFCSSSAPQNQILSMR